MKLPRHLKSLGWWINGSLIIFAASLTVALTVQGNLSQGLIEHPLWRHVLESSTQSVLRIPTNQWEHALSSQGAVQGWIITRDDAGQLNLPVGMPAVFATLAPGYYRESEIEKVSVQSKFSELIAVLTPHWGPFSDGNESTRARSYSVLVTTVKHGKIVMAIDMTDLEDEQNGSVQLSLIFLLANLLMVGLMSYWLHRSLTRPINDLARRMRSLNPLQPSQRLPTTYRKNELNIIAEEANAHLERVELAIERERKLLDQASHEFRTPIAIISGAAYVLDQQELPERAKRPLNRIQDATATLTQIMEALLYLSREASPQQSAQFTSLHTLLPKLVNDHGYLLVNKPVSYLIQEMSPFVLAAPESMVRIAAGNLLRNAAEHTHKGHIRVSLVDETLCIHDSGGGFDAAEAAQRYTQSLQQDGTSVGGGLGLFLTQRICERFGWRLIIESTQAEGTMARICFRSI